MSKFSRRTAALIALGAVAAASGVAALYWSGLDSNGPAGQCRLAKAAFERISPLAKGEVAGVNVAKAPAPAPDLTFAGPDGVPRSLADYKGRTVLFNLWATWCIPCRKEMPALDALQQKLGGPDFEVVAVNMDSRDTQKPRAWLAQAKIAHLSYYADPEGKVFQALRTIGRASGLPTTLLIDKEGCLVAHLDGPAEWASPEAVALLTALTITR